MIRRLHKLLLTLLVGLFLITIVNADNTTDDNGITAEVGETWIKWTWSVNDSIVDVYVDSKLAKDNETKTYYYLQDLEPLERHNLRLYNYTNTSILLGMSTTKTLYPKANIFFLIGVVIILGIIMLVATTQVKIIIIGSLAISLALYASAISLGYEGLYLFPLILATMIGAYIAYSLWDMVKQFMAWY